MSRSLDGLREWVRRSGRPPADAHEGVVVVAGGKGGVGTSTLAGLLALAWSRAGARTLLVEAGPGGLPLHFGVEGEVAGITDLDRGGITPRDLLRSVAPGLELIPAGGWGREVGVEAAAYPLLLRRVMDLYPAFDQVVVDAGSRVDSVHAATQAGGGRLLVVAQRDRVAAAGAYALLKAVGERVPELPAGLAVNRATPTEGRSVAGVIREAAGNFLGREIPLEIVLPPDPALSAASVSGESLATLGESPALRAMGVLVAPATAPSRPVVPQQAAPETEGRTSPGNITRPWVG